jgi:hypothetical protein
MLGIVFALFAYVFIGDFGMTGIADICNIVIVALFWISAILCIISGVIYLMASKDYINPSK